MYNIKIISMDKMKERIPSPLYNGSSHIVIQNGFNFSIVKNRSGLEFKELINSEDFTFVDYDFIRRFNPNKAIYNEHMIALKELNYNSSKNFVIQYKDLM